MKRLMIQTSCYEFFRPFSFSVEWVCKRISCRYTVNYLPVLSIPLLAPDPDVLLDMTGIFKTVYQQGGYDWRIDYTLPVPPPDLRPEITPWVQTLLTPRNN